MVFPWYFHSIPWYLHGLSMIFHGGWHQLKSAKMTHPKPAVASCKDFSFPSLASKRNCKSPSLGSVGCSPASHGPMVPTQVATRGPPFQHVPRPCLPGKRSQFAHGFIFAGISRVHGWYRSNLQLRGRGALPNTWKNCRSFLGFPLKSSKAAGLMHFVGFLRLAICKRPSNGKVERSGLHWCFSTETHLIWNGK